MPKKEIKQKTPVRLRMRRLDNGNKSLYLDIYSDGHRKKEYLKLYLLPEYTDKAKEENRKTLELAETIRAERSLSVLESKSDFFKTERKELKMPFADYMDMEIRRMEDIRTRDYIRRYRCGEEWVRKYDAKTTLGEINKQWLQGFTRFLLSTPGKYGKLLNENSAHEYYTYVANILNNAVREGILEISPTKFLQPIDRPRKYESKRDYLTQEEIRKLIAVPSPEGYHDIRGAFLFACFCGLRYSDIEQLRWRDIKKSEDGVTIEKKLQKTKNLLVLPLSKKAVSFLPERKDNKSLVFKLPSSMVSVEAYIKVWSEFAGIRKHVTFHTSRHTFAVSILAYGGDVYTLSKLLGHKRVTTTQIYADILDENKKKTMELLDKFGK